jgi:hypothetical protein
MLFPSSTSVVLAVVAFSFGGVVAWMLLSRLSGRGRPRRGDRARVETVVERVRAVGKLVGLEVCAKEIATATSGWAWLPPLVLSQARLAMIFNFEKQYSVDLSNISDDDVRDLGAGRFVLRLPAIQGNLRLLDVIPYDIQGAKVLGLLDLVSMTAERQKDLMKKAQQQAAALYETNDERYLAQARFSIERHLRSFMDLFGVEVEVRWADPVRLEKQEELADEPRISLAQRAVQPVVKLRGLLAAG